MSNVPAPAPSSRRGPSSEIMRKARGALVPTVHERMVRALGPARAGEVLGDAFTRFGDRMVDTPQDMLDFAELLMEGGGLVQAVARSLKVQALLHGARER